MISSDELHQSSLLRNRKARRKSFRGLHCYSNSVQDMFTQKSSLCCYCFKRKGPCSLESFYCERALNKITDTRKVQKGGLICTICFWKVTLFQGWRDGSVSKGTCHQVWWLGFGPWVPHGRRRELILASYPLTSACVSQNMFPTTTIKVNTTAILNDIPS